MDGCKEMVQRLKAQNHFPSDQPAWQLWREVQALGSGEFVCCLYKCWFVCWCLRLFINYFTMVACCSSTCTSIAHVSLLLCQICQLLGNICVANLDLRKVVKLLKGKSSKNATFNNATEMLAKALGHPSSCWNGIQCMITRWWYEEPNLWGFGGGEPSVVKSQSPRVDQHLQNPQQVPNPSAYTIVQNWSVPWLFDPHLQHCTIG